MRKRKLVLLGAVLLSSLSVMAQKKSGEQEAIRKVIEAETKYYFEGNFDKWASTWAHDPTSYVVYTSPDNNTEIFGWENISAATKPGLKNTPLIYPEEFVNYEKHDYNYRIGGNLASVTFREGKGNFQIKTLEKQKGEWKVTGLTVISSVSFKLKENFNKLRSAEGKWSYVPGSYKSTPEDNKYLPINYTLDIHEGLYGVEFVTNLSYSYEGRTVISPTTTEQFVPDYTRNEIKYFDFEKATNGSVNTYTGMGSFDTSGNFLVKGMDPARSNKTLFENDYQFRNDGILHCDGRGYDKEGKVTFSWAFDLKRL